MDALNEEEKAMVNGLVDGIIHKEFVTVGHLEIIADLIEAEIERRNDENSNPRPEEDK